MDNAAVLSSQPTGEDAPLLSVSDAILRQSVERALAAFALSPESQVRIDAFDGVIALTGTVVDAAERSALEAAVLGVTAVRAVVEQLETAFQSHQHPTPAEIAREALKQLRQSPCSEDPRIKVVVEHEWLRLEGVASSCSTREEAVRRLRSVRGSRGVIDKLRVMRPTTDRVVAD